MEGTVLRGEAKTPSATVRLEALLPHSAEGPWLARRRLEDSLGRDVDPDLLADLAIIASELVANSVVHGRAGGGGTVALRIDVDGHRVRLEAEDRGRILRRPRARRTSDAALGGRGLRLVDALADRWGVSPGRPTVVWTEVDLLGGRRVPPGVSVLAPSPRTGPRAR